MSHVYNSNGVIKATSAASKPAGYVGRGKKAFTPGRFLVTTNAPSAGTILSGAGMFDGMLSVVAGPAPASAIRRSGRAFNSSGQQYFVTSGAVAYYKDRLSYTSNGDLIVDTT